MKCPHCMSSNEKGATICRACTHPMFIKAPEHKATVWDALLGGAVLLLLVIFL